MGTAAHVAAVLPYPGKATRISRNGQWNTEKDSCGFSTEELKFCVRATYSGFSTEGNWNSVSVVHSWFSTEGGWNSLSVVHTVGSQQRGAEILGPCYIKWILNRRGLKFCVRARYSGFSTERGWNSVSVLHTARRLYPILRKKALRLPPHKVTG